MSTSAFRIFLHPQRSFNQQEYLRNFKECISVCESRQLPGMLLSSSGADFYDPWLMGQYFLSHTKNSSIIVAVNPVYSHPFTTARMLFSLSELYERKIYINFVTGADLQDLNIIGDRTPHDERYKRMDEYITIFKQLVFSRKKFSFKGEYYEVENVCLSGKMNEELLPEFFIAGNSEASLTLAEKHGALNLQMLPNKTEVQNDSNKMVAFSVICRESQEEIENVISTHFPKDRFGEILYTQSLTRTDSEWKKDISENVVKENKNPLFRAESVKYKYTDNPCIAGSKEELKAFFKKAYENGLRNVLITYHNDTDLDAFIEIISSIRNEASA